jgi:4-amino-4-deoxy-L-arabinose transferase-like glycosyltransferase
MVALDVQEEPGFYMRLAVKAALFAILALVSAAGLRWIARRGSRPSDPKASPEFPKKFSPLWTLAPLPLALILLVPNLEAYPWAAPDELHHLVVARNLVEHGEYASGNPDIGFLRFDIYDSVGPSVILPVATAFKAADTCLRSARIVTAAFGFALCGLSYFFLAPVFGSVAGVASVFLLLMSFGTVYLSRSLYGEVPALTFILAGLLCWRHSIQAEHPTRMALVSGVFFGLAALAKTFILLTLFAILGAWLYDRLTHRRLKWPHIVGPGAGLLATLAAWSAVQFLFRDDTSSTGSTLLYYRHYLMFGLQSADAGLAWIIDQPLTAAAIIGAVLYCARFLLGSRYDPPSIVLLLMAVLFAFWWIFFTPGSIPRYMWYTAAIGGLFAGPLLVRAIHCIADSQVRVRIRAAAGIAIVAILLGACIRATEQFQRVYFHDETADDLALAEYLKGVPESASVATTYWPVERSADFFANRHIELVENEERAEAGHDIVISRIDLIGPVPISEHQESQEFGRYIVVSPRREAGSPRE